MPAFDGSAAAQNSAELVLRAVRTICGASGDCDGVFLLPESVTYELSDAAAVLAADMRAVTLVGTRIGDKFIVGRWPATNQLDALLCRRTITTLRGISMQRSDSEPVVHEAIDVVVADVPLGTVSVAVIEHLLRHFQIPNSVVSLVDGVAPRDHLTLRLTPIGGPLVLEPDLTSP